MTGKNNSAGRLHALLSTASQRTANNALEGWSYLLSVPLEPKPNCEREVARLLGLLNGELEVTRAYLKSTTYKPAVYEAALNRVEASLSVMLLNSAFNVVVQHLTPESLGIVAFIAEVMPEESADEPIDEGSIDELRILLDDISKKVIRSDLPDTIKGLLLQQIAFVYRAIREYPIRGANAFRAASLDAFVEMAVHADEMREYQDRDEVKAVVEIWPKVVKYGKRVMLVNGFVASLLGTADLALNVVEKFRSLPPHSTSQPQRSLPEGGRVEVEGRQPNGERIA